MPQIQKTPELRESEITLISQGTNLHGTVELASVARVHGCITGRLIGLPGSQVILASECQIEGDIECDSLWIEGFVRGQITASSKVILTPTARVTGDIECPSVQIEPGAYFDGKCRMAHFSEKTSGSIPGSGTTPPSG